MHAMRTSMFCCARMYSGNSACLNKQDAREAMRVVFFCIYITYVYAQNEISYEYIQILFSKLY